jgi:hypothetical protein
MFHCTSYSIVLARSSLSISSPPMMLCDTSIGLMNRFLLSLILSIILLSFNCNVYAHVRSSSSASLTINTSGANSVKVSLPDRRSSTGGILAECEFNFETSPEGGTKKDANAAKAAEELAKQQAAHAGRIDVATVVASLSGSCISSNSDYWTYELCFGKHFKQFHDTDVYMLAREQAIQSTNNGHSLAMEAGDMCAALNPPKPRAVKLNFACKKNAQVRLEMHIPYTTTEE